MPLLSPALLLAIFLSQPATAPAEQHLPVTFTGGHDTYGPDRGRPVVLIAAALKVTPDVFRDAFSHVHPAPPGQQPDPDQVRKNKQALMDALSKYGVTNDRLDEVSNFYRYRQSPPNAPPTLWKNKPARAEALVKDGRLIEIKLLDPGAGYSSTPTATIDGLDTPLTVELAYGTDLETNGSIKSIKSIKPASSSPDPK